MEKEILEIFIIRKKIMNENELELAKCKNDFVYFCETYVKLNNPQGKTDFKLYDYQKRYIREIQENQFVIGTKPRQMGFTTLNVIYFLWLAKFHDEISYFITGIGRQTRETGRIAIYAIKHFPDFVKENLVVISDFSIETQTSTGGLYFKSVQEQLLSSFDNLYIDEAAYIENIGDKFPNIAKSNGKIAVMSTPSGNKDWFYSTYHLENWHKYECDVQEHPKYTDEFLVNVKKNLGEKRYAIEVEQRFICEELNMNIYDDVVRNIGDIDRKLFDWAYLVVRNQMKWQIQVNEQEISQDKELYKVMLEGICVKIFHEQWFSNLCKHKKLEIDCSIPPEKQDEFIKKVKGKFQESKSNGSHGQTYPLTTAFNLSEALGDTIGEKFESLYTKIMETFESLPEGHKYIICHADLIPLFQRCQCEYMGDYIRVNAELDVYTAQGIQPDSIQVYSDMAVL